MSFCISCRWKQTHRPDVQMSKNIIRKNEKIPSFSFVTFTDINTVRLRGGQLNVNEMERILWFQNTDFLSEVTHYPGNNLQSV